jgi:hypothetical protein
VWWWRDMRLLKDFLKSFPLFIMRFMSMINFLFETNPFLIIKKVTLKTFHSLLANIEFTLGCTSIAQYSPYNFVGICMILVTLTPKGKIRDEKERERERERRASGFSCFREVC